MSYTSTPTSVPQHSHSADRTNFISPNSPSQDNYEATLRQNSRFLNILFWNAGGLNSPKFSELKILIFNYNIDVFIIAEAGAATDNEQFYQLEGYTIPILRRRRQIASGMIIGMITDIASQFKVLHEMDAEDTLEAIQVDAWLNDNHFRIVGVYNPPRNIFNHISLEQAINNNTIIVGDFNAPSKRWGYPLTSPVGNLLESLIDNSSLMITDTSPTFLSFAGHLSRPDLILPHANIFDRCQHHLLDDPAGCGHRAIFISIQPKTHVIPKKILTRWNFKKAKWHDYAKETDILLTTDLRAGNPNHIKRTLQMLFT